MFLNMYPRPSNYVGDMISLNRTTRVFMCESHPDHHTNYPEFHTDKYSVYSEYSEYSDYNNYNDCGFDPCNGSRS